MQQLYNFISILAIHQIDQKQKQFDKNTAHLHSPVRFVTLPYHDLKEY